MTKIAIEINNIYKEYHLGTVGRGTLYRDLQSFWANFRGKEDPNSMIGDADKKENKQILALNDVNLKINNGGILGIIGENGAGKSTLLKILFRVTGPSSGNIKIKGRIASLLEVGTGFHPELTGRENVYLNGTINGMSKLEISKKIDDILEFAGVLKFADTPVKRYSSGMHVRLGFSVAAHLDPDILIVDEVLAVGDAAFNKKAMNKMNSISKEQGRTILFVSHNMASIRTLCNRAILIEKGKVIHDSDPNDTINYYLKKIWQSANTRSKEELIKRVDRKGDGRLKIKSINYFNKSGEEINEVMSGDFLEIRFFYSLSKFIPHQFFNFSVVFTNNKSDMVARFEFDEMGAKFSDVKKDGYFSLTIPKLNLRAGFISIDFTAREGMRGHSWKHIDEMANGRLLEILPGDFWNTGSVNRPGSHALLDAQFKKVEKD